MSFSGEVNSIPEASHRLVHVALATAYAVTFLGNKELIRVRCCIQLGVLSIAELVAEGPKAQRDLVHASLNGDWSVSNRVSSSFSTL